MSRKPSPGARLYLTLSWLSTPASIPYFSKHSEERPVMIQQHP